MFLSWKMGLRQLISLSTWKVYDNENPGAVNICLHWMQRGAENTDQQNWKKDTEAQKDYCQWSLRGGNKERSVREGKGRRMGMEERMRKETWGADGHWSGLCPCCWVAFYYPSSPHCHPRSKSHSALQVQVINTEVFYYLLQSPTIHPTWHIGAIIYISVSLFLTQASPIGNF